MYSLAIPRAARRALACILVHLLVLTVNAFAAQSPPAAATDGRILIYNLPGSAVKPGPAETEVVLAVEIDGAVVATETVRVPPEDPPRDRLIEVLAGQPEVLADIERRLRDGAQNVAVVVSVDGKPYQRLPWKELLAANPAGISTEPASAQSPAAVTASLTTSQQQCSARCDEEYDQCLRTCEPFSGPNACWDCRTQVEACGQFCTSCPLKRKTYGAWKEVLSARQTTGVVQCLVDNAFTTVRLHREFRQTYSRPVTEFTENCDHSITRVTTYEYRYETCWTNLGFFCNSQVDVFGNRKKCP